MKTAIESNGPIVRDFWILFWSRVVEDTETIDRDDGKSKAMDLISNVFLNVQANKAHQCDAIAPGDGAIAKDKVELHRSVVYIVLEVHVVDEIAVKLGEREIMGANESNGGGFKQ